MKTIPNKATFDQVKIGWELYGLNGYNLVLQVNLLVSLVKHHGSAKVELSLCWIQ
jgi:hypothetical protein